MSPLLFAISSADRINAMHAEFAGRTNQHLLHTLYCLSIVTIVLALVLVTSNRLQERKRRREAAQHRAVVDNQVRHIAQSAHRR